MHPKATNISREECRAIKLLSDDKNIIIKPVFKGSAVEQNRIDYINEGYKQLSDEKFYKKAHHMQ